MKNHIYKNDEYIIAFDASIQDDSFSHEFGYKVQKSWVVDNVNSILKFNGDDWLIVPKYKIKLREVL